MTRDLQKASMWKRISAFLFDFILLGILAVLFAWLLSMALGYDGWQQKLEDSYVRVGSQYGVDLRMPAAEYAALTDEQRVPVDAAFDALNADPDALRAYNMVMQLTILMVTFGLLLAYLALEFALPLKLGDGRTLGKRIFGLALMRTDQVRISPVSLFIRTVLGKFAIETMIPAIILVMVLWGSIGIVGPIVLFLILAMQIAVLLATPTNSLIHDLLAGTVCVDYASQMIFNTQEDKIRYIEQQHAEEAARQPY